MIVLNNLGTVEALKNCGLLKYFKLSEMRQQIELLQFLVHAWDPIDQTFHIGDKMVPIMIDDVYFLTGCPSKVPPSHFQDFFVEVNWRGITFNNFVGHVHSLERTGN